MKLKNRAFLFLVVRSVIDEEQHTPIAAFYTLEAAEEYKGVCQQQYKEKNITSYVFKVDPVIYYDQ